MRATEIINKLRPLREVTTRGRRSNKTSTEEKKMEPLIPIEVITPAKKEPIRTLLTSLAGCFVLYLKWNEIERTKTKERKKMTKPVGEHFGRLMMEGKDFVPLSRLEAMRVSSAKPSKPIGNMFCL